jgi:hypothetical protein
MYIYGAGVAVSIVSDYKLDDQGSPWQRKRIFPLACMSRPALRPTQPPIQWASGILTQKK